MTKHISVSLKKACAKCDKYVGVFSCDDCQQSFCLKHVIENRQESASPMDNIEREHDIFYDVLLNQRQKDNEHILFDQINQCEKRICL
ncbi:unnamed protein product [Rotaria sp. Silwood1]|nr:unnamed protein product [Rotaria sp. Silwood1]